MLHSQHVSSSMSSAGVTASVFRRGGPKRELFDEGGGDAGAEGVSIQDADRQQLQQQLEQLLQVLQAPKTGRDLSAAVWRPEVGAVEMVLTRRNTAQAMGFKWRRRQWLHIEEAAFLVDRADLMLFVGQPPSSQLQQQPNSSQQQQPNSSQQQQPDSSQQQQPNSSQQQKQPDSSQQQQPNSSQQQQPPNSSQRAQQQQWHQPPIAGHDQGQQGQGQIHGQEAAVMGGSCGELGQALRQEGVTVGSNREPRGEYRLLSLQEAFELMVLAGVSMERYIVYSNLSRSGYLVMRYPSCWLLPEKQTPADVWGHGAWRGCVHLNAVPLQGGLPAAISHVKSMHQGGVPKHRVALEGEEGDGEAEGEGAGSGGSLNDTLQVDAAQGRQVVTPANRNGAENMAIGEEEHEQVADFQQQSAGYKRQREGNDSASDAGQARKRPTKGAGASSDMSSVAQQTIPVDFVDRQQNGDVQLNGNNAIRAPGEPAAAAAAAAAAADDSNKMRGARWWPQLPELRMMTQLRAAGAQQQQQQQQDVVGVKWQAGEVLGPCNAVMMPAGEVLRAICPRLRPFGGIPVEAIQTLPGAPASSQAFLVYDVYKPGSHVARSKRPPVFPTLAAHLALCSSSPPRLQELQLADAQAMAPSVPVKWVAVEGGIMTLYELGQADLIKLI